MSAVVHIFANECFPMSFRARTIGQEQSHAPGRPPTRKAMRGSPPTTAPPQPSCNKAADLLAEPDLCWFRVRQQTDAGSPSPQKVEHRRQGSRPDA